MNKTDFMSQARVLVNRHGLHHLPVELDRGRKRLGAMHERKVTVQGKTIHTPVKLSFSTHYIELLGWDELEDVVLHEIAHALTPGHKHDVVFMRKCREVGAKPARCASPSASPEATVTAYCPECNRQVAGQFRLPTRVYVCNRCRVGGDKVILVWYRKGIAVPFEAMPKDYQSRVDWYNRRKS